MSFYDPLNRIVQQADGRVIYANGFGGITTIEPDHDKQAQLEQARREISSMDKLDHYW